MNPLSLLRDLLLALPGLVLTIASWAQSPIVTDAGETMRIGVASVTGGFGQWTVTAAVEDDNGDPSLPVSFRRWWHFEVGPFPTGQSGSLAVTLQNCGWSDRILPVWSTSVDGGASFGPWQRCPTSSLPTVSGSTQTFAVPLAPPVTHVRLAKWFPYPVSRRDALLAGIAAHPHVRSIRTLGQTSQGGSIGLVELTDASVPDAQKHRVWIHAAIHPAESPAAFMAEGLVGFLLSGSPISEWLLDNLIVDVVPLANPDGTALGNYRTNAASINCEAEWAAPYTAPHLEVVALRTEIERLMGTSALPAGQPIEVLLNLHASHNVSYPFHFLHVSNPNFDLVSNRSGVVPSVHQLEQDWINALTTESPWVARGTTQSSTLSAPVRPFVESMMHDRWSIDPLWLAAGKPQVMAITLEGTYGRGPDGVAWGTDDDCLNLGAEIGRALGRYFGLLPGSTTDAYGTACNGALLAGNFGPMLDQLTLTTVGLASGSTAITVLGTGQIALTLPAPDFCTLLADPVILLAGTATPIGLHQVQIPIPPGTGALDLTTQTLGLDLSVSTGVWRTSNGLRVRYLP